MKLPTTVTSNGLSSSSPSVWGSGALTPPVSGDPQPPTAHSLCEIWHPVCLGRNTQMTRTSLSSKGSSPHTLKSPPGRSWGGNPPNPPVQTKP